MRADPSTHRQQPRAAVRGTGLRLPPVVFGISALGNLYRVLPLAEKHAIVAACRRHTAGPVVFDGAGKYGAGLALEALGDALRTLGVGVDEVLISNKLGWRRAPLTTAEPTFEPGVWQGLRHDALMDIGGDGILRCHAEGLALLGAPYRTALASLHDPDEYLAGARGDAAERARRMDDIRAAYAALIRLREQGMAKAVGIGAKDWRVLREIVAEIDVDWVMLACSLTIMRHPREVIDWVAGIAARGVAVIDSAVAHGGFLFGGDHLDYRRVDPSDPEHVAAMAWRARFAVVCARHAVAPAAACTQFALRIPGVVSVALNAPNAACVAENVALPEQHVPAAFWHDLLAAGLIDRDSGFTP